jgi:hypothetical protein
VSRFAWLPGDDRQYDLVVTLGDATSAVYSGFIVEEQGTASSFHALAEVIAEHGLFCELYTDRGSHYSHTPRPGASVGPHRLADYDPAGTPCNDAKLAA